MKTDYILKYTFDGRFWNVLRDENDYPAFYGSVKDAEATAKRLWGSKPVQYRVEDIRYYR